MNKIKRVAVPTSKDRNANERIIKKERKGKFNMQASRGRNN